MPWRLEADAVGRTILARWRADNERVAAEAVGDAELAGRLWFELVNHRGPAAFDAQPEDLRRMWLDNFGTARPAASSPEPLTSEQLATMPLPTLVIGSEHGMS